MSYTTSRQEMVLILKWGELFALWEKLLQQLSWEFEGQKISEDQNVTPIDTSNNNIC